MAKDLQKTADFYRKKVGIVDPQAFSSAIQMQYFAPDPDLAPFVAHYVVGRVRADTEYIASFVLSQPAIHAFFTKELSWIMGITTNKQVMHFRSGDVFAAVRFRPGGFYPFWRHRLIDLAEKQLPLIEVLPGANKLFIQQLLAQEDLPIADNIEELLRQKSPEGDDKLVLIKQVIDTIEANTDLKTVRDVAQIFKASERTLQELFTTRVGIGIKWVLMRTRFLRAMEQAHLAAKPNWTAIAADLGYTTQSHFINDFKKTMGVSPTQYTNSLSR